MFPLFVQFLSGTSDSWGNTPQYETVYSIANISYTF